MLERANQIAAVHSHNVSEVKKLNRALKTTFTAITPENNGGGVAEVKALLPKLKESIERAKDEAKKENKALKLSFMLEFNFGYTSQDKTWLPAFVVLLQKLNITPNEIDFICLMGNGGQSFDDQKLSEAESTLISLKSGNKTINGGIELMNRKQAEAFLTEQQLILSTLAQVLDTAKQAFPSFSRSPSTDSVDSIFSGASTPKRGRGRTNSGRERNLFLFSPISPPSTTSSSSSSSMSPLTLSDSPTSISPLKNYRGRGRARGMSTSSTLGSFFSLPPAARDANSPLPAFPDSLVPPPHEEHILKNEVSISLNLKN